jgi:hypothetical protein
MPVGNSNNNSPSRKAPKRQTGALIEKPCKMITGLLLEDIHLP